MVGGRAPRNTFASDIPSVKAYEGPLPENARGIEFSTPVEPYPYGVPGKPTWPRGHPGVLDIDGDTVGIPARFTKRRD
jgi:hypothetical protein